MLKSNFKKIHFIGIGGIGVSGLAHIAKEKGFYITGSDLCENLQTKFLKKIGISISHTHLSTKENGADVVVYSSAITIHNVEYQEAKKQKLLLLSRAEFLAKLMKGSRGIAITGTHGKTTTTGFLLSAFLKASQNPTFVLGGHLFQVGATAQQSQGEWFIAEADESDGSFSQLSPEIIIITNIDEDHMDFYPDRKSLEKAFYNFASRIPKSGFLVINGDDSRTREVFKNFSKKVIFYGFQNQNDYILKKKSQNYQIFHKNHKVCDLKVPLLGRHNALNAMVSVVLANELSLSLNKIVKGISNFKGIRRRLEFRGEIKTSIRVYDDYAHHPVEVEAVLSSLREKYPQRRIVGLFEPHRFTRFQHCWLGFLKAIQSLDVACIFPVYEAGETPIDGISSESFYKALNHPNSFLCSSQKDFLKRSDNILKEGDIMVTLGAGNICQVSDEILSTS